MADWHRTTACDRAAQLLSLSLDGEISSLEEAALDRHLESCGPCRILRSELEDLTEVLRRAPLDTPERELVLPARRPSQRSQLAARGGVLVAAATAAAALVAVVFVGAPTRIVDSEASVLAFAGPHDQARFARIKVSEIEPFGDEAVVETVPKFSHRALR